MVVLVLVLVVSNLIQNSMDPFKCAVLLHTSLDHRCRPQQMQRDPSDGVFRLRRIVPLGAVVEYFFSIVPDKEVCGFENLLMMMMFSLVDDTFTNEDRTIVVCMEVTAW